MALVLLIQVVNSQMPACTKKLVRSFEMTTCSFVVAILIALEGVVVSNPADKCACASVDTRIYSEYGSPESTFGNLSSPNCLPYLQDQRAENNGRIYANVSYYNKPAWLLTSDIYIKDCSALFDCVCNDKSQNVHAEHNKSSLSFMTLKPGQCKPLKSKTQACEGEMWIPIEIDNQVGWIRKDPSSSFHKSCVQPDICPRIISRAEWGARQAKPGVGHLARTPDYAIIHHGASAGCHTREDCVRIIQSYQNFHMDGRGWSDIGYNFIVGEDGNVYEGRGWDAEGAHTYGYNSRSLGFAMIGNFSEEAPNKSSLDSLRKIIACSVFVRKLSPTYMLIGRRDVGRFTISPGEELYAIIQQWEHYNRTVVRK